MQSFQFYVFIYNMYQHNEKVKYLFKLCPENVVIAK
jgi:hypothetical protein